MVVHVDDYSVFVRMLEYDLFDLVCVIICAKLDGYTEIQSVWLLGSILTYEWFLALRLTSQAWWTMNSWRDWASRRVQERL